MLTAEEARFIRGLEARIIRQDSVIAAMRGAAGRGGADFDLVDIPPNSRPIFYTLADRLAFDATDDGQRATPLNFLISQDGPFFCTHYPVVLWKPNAPSNATNFGQWSPVYSSSLPTQQNTDQDRIDLSYEVVDGGSQRNFQNEAAPPIFSRPDHLIPLPARTRWEPNSTVQFFPTFENILFDATPAVPTTGGELVVAFPGFKMVPAGVP